MFNLMGTLGDNCLPDHQSVEKGTKAKAPLSLKKKCTKFSVSFRWHGDTLKH